MPEIDDEIVTCDSFYWTEMLLEVLDGWYFVDFAWEWGTAHDVFDGVLLVFLCIFFCGKEVCDILLCLFVIS